MARTSRRSLLAGLAASPFAAVPALAAAAPHPDMALLAMASELDALIATAHAAGRRCREMEEIISAMVGPRPVRPADDPFLEPESKRAAWGRYEADCRLSYEKREEMEAAAGFEAMEAVYDEADSAVLRGMERLAATPATTLDGLMLKARMANHDHEGIPASIVADLLAMGGKA